LLSAVLVVCLVQGLYMQARAQGGGEKDKGDKTSTDKPAVSKVFEAKHSFEMRDKPWKGVFEWLTDKTGIPFISDEPPPTGSFNFIAKQGQKYSIPEVIDIINEGLLYKKFLLIRRETAFTIVPADVKIPPELLPRIRLDDLDKHGATEMVS